MANFNLYYISNDYIDYLRTFDRRVFINKNRTRPYVGVVYIYNCFNYFAPLASPKAKHKKMSAKAWDIFKIKDGELGIVNINNMVPTPKECLSLVLPTIQDEKYKNLLINQLTFLNKHKAKLNKKINFFQTLYHKNYLDAKTISRCCNFSLLEEKCLEYNFEKQIV